MCVDNRRSCFGKKFCNEDCLVKGWRESGAVAPGVHKKKGEEDERQVREGPTQPSPRLYFISSFASPHLTFTFTFAPAAGCKVAPALPESRPELSRPEGGAKVQPHSQGRR